MPGPDIPVDSDTTHQISDAAWRELDDYLDVLSTQVEASGPARSSLPDASPLFPPGPSLPPEEPWMNFGVDDASRDGYENESSQERIVVDNMAEMIPRVVAFIQQHKLEPDAAVEQAAQEQGLTEQIREVVAIHNAVLPEINSLLQNPEAVQKAALALMEDYVASQNH